MSDLITITRWASLTKTHGQRVQMPWAELTTLLSTPQTIGLVPSKKKDRAGKLDPNKDSLPGWSAATFSPLPATVLNEKRTAPKCLNCSVDHRHRESCLSVTAAMIDYDGGATLAQAVNLWTPYRGFIHTSPSHRFEDYGDRFRVVLRLSRPVTRDEHERLWSWIKAKCDAAGHVIDEAPKDPSRLWFLPGRLDGAPFETHELLGDVLDVDAVLAQVPTPQANRTVTKSAVKQPALPTPNATQPSRHKELVKQAARLRGRGAQTDHIAAALHDMNAGFTEPKPESEVDKIAGWGGRLPDGTEQWFRYSDTINADEIIHDHGGVLRDCHERGWMHYHRMRWSHDKKIPIKLAEQTMRRVAADAVHKGEKGNLITKLLKRDTATAALGFVGPRLAIRIDKFDTDRWLFNCRNGTLDLRTGVLRPHNPKDFITKLAGVSCDPDAKCPMWLAHLEKVLPDPEVRRYLQRLAGYALTGVIREHVLPIHWGDGGNGKGVTFNTLLRIWGDYGTSVPVELLMQRDGHDEHPTERAQLLGARLVVASETTKGRRLNEALIKQLTGADPMKARFMHKDYFLFLPTWKLQVLTNHRPGVRGTDTGIWRRVKLTPWTVILPESEQKTDFEEILVTELSGILNWAVEGCLEWQKTGLAAPKAVTEATQKFREESDVLGRFLHERCVLFQSASVAASALYVAFKEWCRDNDEKEWSQKAFSTDLLHRLPTIERDRGRSARFYRGIGLTEPASEVTGVDRINQDEASMCHAHKDIHADLEPKTATVTHVTHVTDVPANSSTRAHIDANLGNASHASHASQGVVCASCGGRIDGYGVCVECGAGAATDDN